MAKKIKQEEIKPLAELIGETMEKKHNVTIKIKHDPLAPLPKYAHDGDIGMDVTAIKVEYDIDMDAYIYHTGIYSESERNVGCFAMARSGNRKTEAFLPNSVGLIDTFTYRGEICFTFKNRTSIEVIAATYVMFELDRIPWWKRLFVSYIDLWHKKYNELLNDPMQFAPYEVGDRIGQLVFFTHPTVNIEEVDELSETERGEGGHGSTGK